MSDATRPSRIARSTSSALVANARPVGIERENAARDVDLLELRLRGDLLGRHVDRPELAAHAALAQPLEVGVAGRAPPQVVCEHVARRGRVLADRPGQVVVPVDHGMARENCLRSRERIVVGARARRARSEKSGGAKDKRRNERPRLMLRLRHTRRSLADEATWCSARPTR
jgi:hypothetical protein